MRAARSPHAPNLSRTAKVLVVGTVCGLLWVAIALLVRGAAIALGGSP